MLSKGEPLHSENCISGPEIHSALGFLLLCSALEGRKGLHFQVTVQGSEDKKPSSNLKQKPYRNVAWWDQHVHAQLAFLHIPLRLGK